MPPSSRSADQSEPRDQRRGLRVESVVNPPLAAAARTKARQAREAANAANGTPRPSAPSAPAVGAVAVLAERACRLSPWPKLHRTLSSHAPRAYFQPCGARLTVDQTVDRPERGLRKLR